MYRLSQQKLCDATGHLVSVHGETSIGVCVYVQISDIAQSLWRIYIWSLHFLSQHEAEIAIVFLLYCGVYVSKMDP